MAARLQAKMPAAPQLAGSAQGPRLLGPWACGPRRRRMTPTLAASVPHPLGDAQQLEGLGRLTART